MEPITHALASVALGRAGLNKLSRAATPMLLISGLIADADWAARLGAPEMFLRGHRTVTHSFVGTAAIVITVAAAAWFVGRKFRNFAVGVLPALAICATGAGMHLFLDLLNGYGVKLLWPFSEKWYAWDLVGSVDWWVFFFLLAGLLIPELFRLVHEEIGSKPKRNGRQRGALIALALAALLVAGRAVAHERAVALLDARTYRGQTPLAVAAFPTASNPLRWYGVVETDSAIVNVDVPLGPGRAFDPEAGAVHFKPEPSAMLKGARESPAGREFLNFARFPLARVQREGDGFVVQIEDMRFAGAQEPGSGREFDAVIHENERAAATQGQIEFALDAAK